MSRKIVSLIVFINLINLFNCLDFFVSYPDDLMFLDEEIQTLDKIRVARQAVQNGMVGNGNNRGVTQGNRAGNKVRSAKVQFTNFQGSGGQRGSRGMSNGNSMMNQRGSTTGGSMGNGQMTRQNGAYPQNKMNQMGQQSTGFQSNGQNFGSTNGMMNNTRSPGMNQNGMRPMMGLSGQNSNRQQSQPQGQPQTQIYRAQSGRRRG